VGENILLFVSSIWEKWRERERKKEKEFNKEIRSKEIGEY